MKKILFFICIFFCVKISLAQTKTATDSIAQKNKSISFIAYWSKGDSYNFKVSKIKKTIKEGKITKDKKQEYIASFTVLDSTENSYLISWKYENDLENTFKLPKELANKFSKYKFTEIKYKTSELGEFQEIINWKEVSNIMLQMVNDIIETLAKDEESKKVMKKAMDAFKKIYSSRQGIEQLVVKELQYFHFPMGYEFETNIKLEYDDKLPNMFGGKPLKAKGSVIFESVNEKDGFCVVKQTLDVDTEDTKAMLKSVFIKMGFKDEKLIEALKTGNISIKDKNTYEYYYNPGIPHKIESVRETNLNLMNEKGKNFEKIIIELQYNENEELEE